MFNNVVGLTLYIHVHYIFSRIPADNEGGIWVESRWSVNSAQFQPQFDIRHKNNLFKSHFCTAKLHSHDNNTKKNTVQRYVMTTILTFQHFNLQTFGYISKQKEYLLFKKNCCFH